MKVTFLLITIMVFSCFIVNCISCTSIDSIDTSVVQIWKSSDKGNGNSLLSFGVVVDDGSKILTVINYEDDIPSDLLVGVHGKAKLHASIQAIYPETSVTLLQLEGTKLTPAKIVTNTSKIQTGSAIFIYGWSDPGSGELGKKNESFPGYGKNFFITLDDKPSLVREGAVVTNKKDEVIGLVGTFYNSFVFSLGGPGLAPPISNIQNAMEMLSLDVADQVWPKNPVYTLQVTINSKGNQILSEPPKEKYNEMAINLRALLNTMGEPLPNTELLTNFRDYIYGIPENPPDGIYFGAVYPEPVDLLNTEGQVVAKTRWVGIQWGRGEGKPNRVFFGHFEQGNTAIDGGFYLLGNVSELESTLH